MKTYELTQANVKMIVDALDFSIDALRETKKHCDKIAQRINVDCRIDNITDKIGELTTLKNYLEQY
jgi:hypothetical protein